MYHHGNQWNTATSKTNFGSNEMSLRGSGWNQLQYGLVVSCSNMEDGTPQNKVETMFALPCKY